MGCTSAPALRAMAGCQALDRPRLAAIAAVGLPRRPGPKLNLIRVTAWTGPDGVLRVRPSGGQESHMLRVMAAANALALLPHGHGARAGQRVEVLVLDAGALAPAGVTRFAGPGRITRLNRLYGPARHDICATVLHLAQEAHASRAKVPTERFFQGAPWTKCHSSGRAGLNRVTSQLGAHHV